MKIIFRSMTIILLTFMLFTFIVTLSYAENDKQDKPEAQQITPGYGDNQNESSNQNPDEATEIQIMEKTRQLNELRNLYKEIKKTQQSIEKTINKLAGGTGLGEFGFGIGFGNIILQGDGDITSAVPDNGIIAITGQERYKMGLWLTTSWVHDTWPFPYVNFGPFFGVQLGGNDDIVNSMAVGLELSFRKLLPELPLDFQVGWAWTKAKELASGYEEGKSLPSDTSQVLLKNTVNHGFVFIVSYNFGRPVK